MSRPVYSLDASVERIRGQIDRLVEDDRFSHDTVFDALLEIETHCQEWREAISARKPGARLDASGDGE